MDKAVLTEILVVSIKAVQWYLIPFVAFTAFGLLLKGREAITWSKDLLGSVRSNLLLSLLNPMIAPLIMTGVVLVRSGYQQLGIPETPLSFWQQVPPWAVVICWLLAIDFVDYWVHRLLHAPGFWDIHAVHHSDEHLNWTTTSRVHILEVVVMQIGYILLATWMNIPAEGVGLAVAFRMLHNNWVHTRYDFHLGPFTKVLATPRFHHWHHADEPSAYNTNFANTFAFWDILFGTYRVPGRYDGKYGFEGTPGNDTVRLLIWPYHQWLSAALGMRNKKRTNY